MLLMYVRTSHQRCPLSKSNSFDQNFMKFGHIVKNHMSPSSWKMEFGHIVKNHMSPSSWKMEFGHIVKNHMSPSSWKMVHITPCLQELLSFVHEDSPYCLSSVILFTTLCNLVTMLNTVIFGLFLMIG